MTANESWKRNLPLFCLLGWWLLLPGCSSRQKPEAPAGVSGYSAKIKCRSTSLRAFEGRAINVELFIKNTGEEAWSSQAQNPCLLSYHILDRSGRVLKFDNARTVLPGDVLPGNEISISARVKVPLAAGDYRVEFDLLREGAAWFKDSGSSTLALPLRVEEKIWTGGTRIESSVPEFMSLQKLIRATLEDDAVDFLGKTGMVRGFAAGTGYPQVWLRDGATIIPASRFSYPEAFLLSWLEELLSLQKADGSLVDWVDAQGRSDKNTVETDQEASAVHSAYQIFLLKGKAWLEKRVEGELVINRLERAIESVFQNRFDRERGLITGAHTADWGDVDPEDADQKAIYVDGQTRWTADIYDQSMIYEACREMASMSRAIGSLERADSWDARADALRTATDLQLWQEDRGFYRVHLHLDPFPHDFDEDSMFAMGGNTQAVISGLAEAGKAQRIIQTALERQDQFGMSSISGSLLPPYPAGFFKHPAMDEPYEYQNGGQWDWFGGRLVLAMFGNGFSSHAREKLIQIIRKDVRNGGLFEWDTKDGSGRGSDDYAGSAGSLARALFEGYFGFKLGEKSLILEPNLGPDEAQLSLQIPASGLALTYKYRPLQTEKKVIFSYESNYPGAGEVRLLVPWSLFGIADREAGKQKLQVLRDGTPCPVRSLSRGQDDYLAVEGDLRKHTLEIALREPE